MTIEGVYDALESLIGGVSVAYSGGTYTLNTKAQVVPYSPLEGARDEWGAQLRSAKDSNRIHTWFFTQLDTRHTSKRLTPGQEHGFWEIFVYGYLEKREGTTPHSTNSDRQFQMECNAIEDALNGPRSSMPFVVHPDILFHLGRNFDVLGKTTVHIAVGSLLVYGC